MHDYKTLLRRAGAVLFWLAVWQAAAMVIGQEVFLVSPVQALRCLLRLLPQADFCVPVYHTPPQRPMTCASPAREALFPKDTFVQFRYA